MASEVPGPGIESNPHHNSDPHHSSVNSGSLTTRHAGNSEGELFFCAKTLRGFPPRPQAGRHHGAGGPHEVTLYDKESEEPRFAVAFAVAREMETSALHSVKKWYKRSGGALAEPPCWPPTLGFLFSSTARVAVTSVFVWQ